MLTENERVRYDRQISIQEIGEEGQEKLRNTTVFMAGAGGLGSPALIYLTAAGVGTIRVVDHECVEPSNLNRQILHWQRDIGRRKIESASEKLMYFNPDMKLEPIAEEIAEGNVNELVKGCDLIVDALDNLTTRYLLNKSALENNIPFFHGAVHGFEGRAMTVIPGKTACLRCMYRGPIPEESVPVIGVTPAVIGCIQATEVIKYILDIGDLLTDRLLIYNGLDLKFTEFRLRKNPNCDHCSDLTRRR